jgi:hypothetical protein
LEKKKYKNLKLFILNMKLTKLVFDNKDISQIEKFNNLLIFPAEGTECLIFNELSIFKFRQFFPFFNPLGNNLAIVNISSEFKELYDIVLKHPKFIYINNGNMFMYPLSYSFSWDNIAGADSEQLIRFLKDDLDIAWAETAEICKSDDGKTLRIIKDEDSAEITIEEEKEKATLKFSDGKTLDLKVKKENDCLNICPELNFLKNSYNSDILNESFSVLERYTDMERNVNPLLVFISLIKNDFPNVDIFEKIAQVGFPYREIIGKEERGIVDNKIFELLPNQSGGLIYARFKKEVRPLIEAYPSFFGVLSRARWMKENIPNFIPQKVNEILSADRIRKRDIPEHLIRSLDFRIRYYDKAILGDLILKLRDHKIIRLDMERSVSMKAELVKKSVRIEIQGRISPDTFSADKRKITELLLNILREIKKVKEQKITLEHKGIGLLLPQEYLKSGNFLNFLDKYNLQIMMAGQQRKMQSTYGGYFPIDFEFLLGESLIGKPSYKGQRKNLENAHLLTKTAVRYILDGHYLKGKELLQATKKAFEADFEFLETGKTPSYDKLRIYAFTHDDEIVGDFVNNNPPITDYDVNQCLKHYEINDKYLNYTKNSGSLHSFRNLLGLKTHLKSASNSKVFRKYIYLYSATLQAMGIEGDNIEDLLFTLRLFF